MLAMCSQKVLERKKEKKTRVAGGRERNTWSDCKAVRSASTGEYGRRQTGVLILLLIILTNLLTTNHLANQRNCTVSGQPDFMTLAGFRFV